MNPDMLNLQRLVNESHERLQASGALRSLYLAVTDQGASPAHHRKVMAKSRREWPALWRAIDALLDEYRVKTTTVLPNRLRSPWVGVYPGVTGDTQSPTPEEPTMRNDDTVDVTYREDETAEQSAMRAVAEATRLHVERPTFTYSSPDRRADLNVSPGTWGTVGRVVHLETVAHLDERRTGVTVAISLDLDEVRVLRDQLSAILDILGD